MINKLLCGSTDRRILFLLLYVGLAGLVLMTYAPHVLSMTLVIIVALSVLLLAFVVGHVSLENMTTLLRNSEPIQVVIQKVPKVNKLTESFQTDCRTAEGIVENSKCQSVAVAIAAREIVNGTVREGTQLLFAEIGRGNELRLISKHWLKYLPLDVSEKYSAAMSGSNNHLFMRGAMLRAHYK